MEKENTNISPWISVEDKDNFPKEAEEVIGFDGKNKHLCFWIGKHSHEAHWEDEDDRLSDYLESEDVAYWKEGWYSEEEQFQSEFDSVWTPRNIILFMPIPQPPKQK
jgi:hypothetical protein